jgi:hypothetical protein
MSTMTQLKYYLQRKQSLHNWIKSYILYIFLFDIIHYATIMNYERANKHKL